MARFWIAPDAWHTFFVAVDEWHDAAREVARVAYRRAVESVSVVS